MASCNVCQLEGLVWSENVNQFGKHYLYNENTGQPHACKPKLQPNPIPTVEMFGDIPCDRKPESLALAITNEAVRCGLSPFTVKLEHRGNWIILH